MKKKHTTDTVFALLLYGLFAFISLMLVLTGIKVYRGIVKRTDARNDLRVSLSYVANKVRSSSEVKLENREGMAVLVLPEHEGDQTFETLIYFYDGKLRELFQIQGEAFSPDSGEELTALNDFSFKESENGVLTVISQSTDGSEHMIHIQKRTG